MGTYVSTSTDQSQNVIDQTGAQNALSLSDVSGSRVNASDNSENTGLILSDAKTGDISYTTSDYGAIKESFGFANEALESISLLSEKQGKQSNDALEKVSSLAETFKTGEGTSKGALIKYAIGGVAIVLVVGSFAYALGSK